MQNFIQSFKYIIFTVIAFNLSAYSCSIEKTSEEVTKKVVKGSGKGAIDAVGEIAEEVTDATVKYMEGDSTAQNSSWGKAADNVGKIGDMITDKTIENIEGSTKEILQDLRGFVRGERTFESDIFSCFCDLPFPQEDVHKELTS